MTIEIPSYVLPPELAEFCAEATFDTKHGVTGYVDCWDPIREHHYTESTEGLVPCGPVTVEVFAPEDYPTLTAEQLRTLTNSVVEFVREAGSEVLSIINN